ncbi:MAG: SPOR domain-containing protein, partial [Acidobacteriota bacterium]
EELTFFDTLKNDKPVTLEDYPDSPSGKKGRRGSRRRAEGGSKPRDQDSMRSVGEGIMIQVLASGQRSVAKALTTKLRRKGYTALLIKEGGTYKVRVGPYADRVEAERAAGVLREQEHLTTWIP